MPDISMCRGEGCHLKERCFRYTAPESHRQTFMSTPYDSKTKTCGYFWDTTKENWAS